MSLLEAFEMDLPEGQFDNETEANVPFKTKQMNNNITGQQKYST